MIKVTTTRLRSLQAISEQRLPALSRNDCFVLAQAQALRVFSLCGSLLITDTAAEKRGSRELSLASFLDLVAQEVDSIWQQVRADRPETATAPARLPAAPAIAPTRLRHPHSQQPDAQPQPLPWPLQDFFDSLDGKAGNS
ncbi:hypothetical protein [Thermogemmatispora tikiterensis]|uniref:Uncharacterized protein n=1 Tax=Thermogemmatispora tikiterensis TaxID=1825093 RepID=A0A328VLT8_9CHLR|nr:hypothetical protein [Thermogemmatispora tikiterensis]RAQ97821.1 hypothetical protein A4R35_19935 [Thermogemmatispora tikiterensis]